LNSGKFLSHLPDFDVYFPLLFLILSRLKETDLQTQAIYTLDLNFMGVPGSIASYLIRHAGGCILIESGPGSTQATMQARLAEHGLSLSDVTDVFLTHIHLDHAGAAGWLARQGARVHVHSAGAPHLLDPEKLLSSAARIYGDMMDTLWGQFLPVPEQSLSVLQDGQVVTIGGVSLQAIETLGHAEHHFAYLFDDVCFSGDIGGVRPAGERSLRLPLVPPEFNLEKWRGSLQRMRDLKFKQIAPTHFGLFDDPHWHLQAIERELDMVDEWISVTLPACSDLEDVSAHFMEWTRSRYDAEHITPAQVEFFETANPSWMSPAGIYRYWRKVRNPA
jgi:glyoxylase-like metal-dependent hydrolase (beta-lactamase superfamily II)